MRAPRTHLLPGPPAALLAGRLVLLALLPTLACSGGSSTGNSSSGFKITDISVKSGQEWKINRPIDITFNRDVEFATVSLNTIRVSDEQGNSATGFFSRPPGANGEPNPRRVRFQPTCPTREDNSDAGLRPFTTYQLTVLGSIVGGPTVSSTAGDGLDEGKLVTFHTPNSNDALELFLDTVPGPPAVRLRGVGGVGLDELAATHLEVGGVAVYFALDPTTQQGRLPAGFLVPLNHYSIPENQVSVSLHFNQAVLATEANISADFLGLEYFDGSDWQAVPTQVQLIDNCTETGAEVRLTPGGILPQESPLRVKVRSGFSDLSGDLSGTDSTGFAVMVTVQADGANPLFPGVQNPEADGVLETFALAGDGLGSLEDSQVAFEVPQADWGSGRLEASFAFGGTGGPAGTFDWHIPPGVEFLLDTVADTIVGGDGGVPETSQAVINGLVDIRDLFIPASSRLIILGPNTCTILASGNVLILGDILVRGSNSTGVNGLNTTNLPESGAVGQGGGGDGGAGSFLTSQSTPRGGSGEGAFGLANGGGEGGETSYSPAGIALRRGAGGGGGLLGPDVYYDHDGDPGNVLVRCQTLVGMDVEAGAMGGSGGLGAESQATRAAGGEVGRSPFTDSADDNNFLGTLLLSSGELIVGELDRLWAGGGGG
ncbi:MAG: hypothetical protein V3T22_08255, partial [Planctomycetota bacterium]